MLNLVPRPKEISEVGKDFVLRGAITIVDCARSKDASVEQLAECVKSRTGRSPKVVTSLLSARCSPRIILRVEPDHPDLPSAEAYQLSVDGDITITGRTAAGVFYGVQGLKMILRKARGKVSGALIRDWPDYSERILMYDFARQQHVRLGYLEQVLTRAAELKYNKFMCYLEGRFAFQSHPHLGPKGAMTADDVRHLERVAKRLHIELVPQFNALAHNEIILSNPLYKDLAEDEANPYQICASNPDSMRLIRDLTTEMAAIFPSSLFHAGGDETAQLGQCPACAKSAQTLGPGGLYARHYLSVIRHLKQLGKTVALWGDMILHHREIANLLPKDVVIYDWHYTGTSPDSVAFFLRKGFPVTVCPSDSSFWAGTVPYDTPTENILRFLPDAYRLGARSMCMTVWEMYRGNFMQNNWYPVALAADTAWNTVSARFTAAHLTSFQRRFCETLLGTSQRTFFDCLRLVAHGDSERVETLPIFSVLFRRAFFTDPDPFFLYLRFTRDIGPRERLAWNRFLRKADRLVKQTQRDARLNRDITEMLDVPVLMLHAACRRITGLQVASEIYRRLYARQSKLRPSTVQRGLARCRSLVEGLAADCEALERRLEEAHRKYGSPWEDVLQMRRHAAHFRTYARYIGYHESHFAKGVPLVQPGALYL